MIRKFAMAAALAALLPVLATAREAAPTPAPDFAAARVQMERLIAGSGDPAAFGGVVSPHGLIIIQHNASGMRCGFGDPGERLEIIAPTAEHDGGVRCLMTSKDGHYPVVVEVVRPRARVDLAKMAAAGLAADQAKWPDLQVVRTGPKGRPKIEMRDRVLTFDGDPPTRYVYAAEALKGAWLITVRLDDNPTREGFKADTAEFIGMIHVISAADLLKD